MDLYKKLKSVAPGVKLGPDFDGPKQRNIVRDDRSRNTKFCKWLHLIDLFKIITGL